MAIKSARSRSKRGKSHKKLGRGKKLPSTGGVARNIGMVRALEEVLQAEVQVSPQAHFTGAIGAALFALQKMGQSFESSLWNPAHATDRGH